jgi:transposase
LENCFFVSPFMDRAMPKSFVQISIGIDIAKDDFKACIMGRLADKQCKVIASHTFTNQSKSFPVFWNWVNKHTEKFGLEAEFLMEATGVYHENLAWSLYEKQALVVIVLPNQAKAFFRSEGFKSKNDKIDAQGLAKMSLSKALKRWTPISPVLHRLRTQTRHHTSLQKELNRVENQLHALLHSHAPDKLVQKLLEKNIAFLSQQVAQIRESIEGIVQEDAVFYKRLRHLTTIYGVGLLTAAVVVAETGGFELFSSQAQLVSFAGYDVAENQSGTHQGKGRISKKGNTHIRRILFMPAFNAVKTQGICRDLYFRVFERTKIKMKAYVAVQRKLLCLMYTLWKKEEDFDTRKAKEKAQNKFVEGQDALLLEVVAQ